MASSAAASASSSSSSKRCLTIVITGASRGLGAGMARTYLKQGHKLGLCSRSAPPADLDSSSSSSMAAGAANSKNLYYESDVNVCDPNAVQTFLDNVVQTFGNPIDVWINNAGILKPIQPIRNTPFEEFDANIQTNLSGVFHCTKAFIHHARSKAQQQQQQTQEANNSDQIDTFSVTSTLVNISSGAAVKGYAGWGAYCSSKAAVDRLTECALLEETMSENDAENGDNDAAKDMIFRAYSIAPGVIDTDMQTMIRSTSPKDFPMVSKFLDIKANNSFNTPPYIAKYIEDLALQSGPQTLPVVQRIPSEPKSVISSDD